MDKGQVKILVKWGLGLFVMFGLLFNFNSVWVKKVLAYSSYGYVVDCAGAWLGAGDRGTEFLGKSNYLVISRLGLRAPLVFTTQRAPEKMRKELKAGVLHYPFSVLPGTEGAVMILGHSAPDYWPDINYDRIFSRLDELQKGDSIKIYFNGWKYQYRVSRVFLLKPGEKAVDEQEIGESKVILITCWPPGSRTGRLAVEAIYE